MMIILVTANNFLLMFVGWEGVGICSYLLVSFWFTRIAANQSSMSAFLTNRVGDCFLTIGMFAILWSFGNIDYSTVFSLAPFVNENIVTIIGICLLIGAMAKSSQVGLHVWLPMAMEGPTPVSALIHAATMVTAGVYLLMRSSPLIEYSSTVLLLCLWLGAITTIFSSLIGLFQQDIKKVIAYSTMSQLGMMVIAVGLSSYNVALFHLVNHAFYKALLFLGAGSVIHAVADNQDFRKYGGLRAYLPLTYSVMLIASLSLVAFPFMTGFYSKDLILESAYGHFSFSSIVVYFIATIGAMFTTLYSVKVLYLTFLSNPNGPLLNYKKAHEGDIFMSMPLVVLAIFSIFFGYITKDIFIGLGSSFFSDNSLFIHPIHEIMLDTEFAVSSVFKLLPLVLTIALSLISLLFSEFLPYTLIYFKFSRLGYNVFSFFNQRFLIELFYNKYVTGIIFKLGGQTTKVLDKGSVELIGPFGLEKTLVNVSRNIAGLDSGIITSYALYILIALLIYMLIPYFYIINSSMILLIVLGLYVGLNKGLINPPRPHSFVNLPLQSGLSSTLATLYEVWPLVEPYINSFDINVSKWVGNVGRSIGVAAPIAGEVTSPANISCVYQNDMLSMIKKASSSPMFTASVAGLTCFTLCSLLFYWPLVAEALIHIPTGYYTIDLQPFLQIVHYVTHHPEGMSYYIAYKFSSIFVFVYNHYPFYPFETAHVQLFPHLVNEWDWAIDAFHVFTYFFDFTPWQTGLIVGVGLGTMAYLAHYAINML